MMHLRRFFEEIVLKFREYKKAKQAMEEAEELMQDPERNFILNDGRNKFKSL